MQIWHKYQDEQKLVVFDYGAELTIHADSLLTATLSRTGPAVLTLGSPLVGATSVACMISSGTYNPVPPPHPDEDYTDLIRCSALTAAGQVLDCFCSITMRQPDFWVPVYTKQVDEAVAVLFDYSLAVGAPYNDPLVASPSGPLVAQVTGTDGALVYGTPEIVAVGTLANSGVRAILSVGVSGSSYIVRSLVYTSRGLRLQTNLKLIIS